MRAAIWSSRGRELLNPDVEIVLREHVKSLSGDTVKCDIARREDLSGHLPQPTTRLLTLHEGEEVVFCGYLNSVAYSTGRTETEWVSFRNYPNLAVHGGDQSWSNKDTSLVVKDLWMECLRHEGTPNYISVTTSDSGVVTGVGDDPVTASWHAGTNVGQLISSLMTAAELETTERYEMVGGQPEVRIDVAKRRILAPSAHFDETNIVDADFKLALSADETPSGVHILGGGQGPSRVVADAVSSNSEKLRSIIVQSVSESLTSTEAAAVARKAVLAAEKPLPATHFAVRYESALAEPDRYRPGRTISFDAFGERYVARVTSVVYTGDPSTRTIELQQI